MSDSGNELRARSGDRVRVTIEGRISGDLPSDWDTLDVETDHGRVYVEFGKPEGITVEVVPEPVVSGRMYEDTEGKTLLIRQEREELFVYYTELPGRFRLEHLRPGLLPLRQVWPPRK